MYYIRDLCLRVHCTVTCRITPLTIPFPLSPLARPPACCKDDTSGGDSDDGNVGDMKRIIDADKPFVCLSNAGAREEFVGQMFTKVFTTDETDSLWVGEITGYDATKDGFTVLYISDGIEVPTTRGEVQALAEEGGPHHKYFSWSGDQHDVQRAERILPFSFRNSDLCSSMEVEDVVEVVMEARDLRVREMVYRGEVVRRQRLRGMTHLTVRWYREEEVTGRRRCSVLYDGRVPIRMVESDSLTLEELKRIQVTRGRGGKKGGGKKGTKGGGRRRGRGHDASTQQRPRPPLPLLHLLPPPLVPPPSLIPAATLVTALTATVVVREGAGPAGRARVRRVVATKKGVAAAGPAVTAAVQVLAAEGTAVKSGMMEDTGWCGVGQGLQSCRRTRRGRWCVRIWPSFH